MLKFGVQFSAFGGQNAKLLEIVFIQQYSVLCVEFEKEKKNEKEMNTSEKSEKNLRKICRHILG